MGMDRNMGIGPGENCHYVHVLVSHWTMSTVTRIERVEYRHVKPFISARSLFSILNQSVGPSLLQDHCNLLCNPASSCF